MPSLRIRMMFGWTVVQCRYASSSVRRSSPVAGSNHLYFRMAQLFERRLVVFISIAYRACSLSRFT